MDHTPQAPLHFLLKPAGQLWMSKNVAIIVVDTMVLERIIVRVRTERGKMPKVLIRKGKNGYGIFEAGVYSKSR